MKYKNKKGGLKNIEYKTIIYQKQKQKHMLAKKEGKGKIMRNIRNKKMTKTSNNQLSNTTYANAIKNCTLWILIVALVITPMQYQSYILRQKIQKLEEEYKTKNVNVNQKYPVAGVSNLLNGSMEKNNTVSISKLDNDILTTSYVDTIVLLENIIKEGEKNKDTETNDQNTEKKAKSNKKENDKQSSVTELDEEIKYYHPTFTSSTNIKSSSGLTAKQIDKLVKDTGLYGLGGAIKDIEDIYGINAYFTLGVASLESGYGKSNLAKSKNNCFGISTSRVFNNKAESVYYFGHIIDVYDKKHNIEMNTSKINKRYCELSSWTGHVVTIMNKYVNDANKIF